MVYSMCQSERDDFRERKILSIPMGTLEKKHPELLAEYYCLYSTLVSGQAP